MAGQKNSFHDFATILVWNGNAEIGRKGQKERG
jgi:hypothetical protein